MINSTDRVLDLDEAMDLLNAYHARQKGHEPVVCTESVLDGKICILLEIPLESPDLSEPITVYPKDAIARWNQTRTKKMIS